MGPGTYTQTRGPCEDCNGQGSNLTEQDKCTACKGERVKEESKEFEIRVEPGAPDNYVYTLPGEGNETVKLNINYSRMLMQAM